MAILPKAQITTLTRAQSFDIKTEVHMYQMLWSMSCVHLDCLVLIWQLETAQQ